MKTIIAACCICKKVRDGLPKGGDGEGSWVTLRTYRAKYHPSEKDLRLSHTYCPDCMKRYRRLLFRATADSHAPPL